MQVFSGRPNDSEPKINFLVKIPTRPTQKIMVSSSARYPGSPGNPIPIWWLGDGVLHLPRDTPSTLTSCHRPHWRLCPLRPFTLPRAPAIACSGSTMLAVEDSRVDLIPFALPSPSLILVPIHKYQFSTPIPLHAHSRLSIGCQKDRDTRRFEIPSHKVEIHLGYDQILLVQLKVMNLHVCLFHALRDW